MMIKARCPNPLCKSNFKFFGALRISKDGKNDLICTKCGLHVDPFSIFDNKKSKEAKQCP
jgi:hypothetical protein